MSRFVSRAMAMGQSAISSAPVAAPKPSHSLEEARSRARSLFREVCREMPHISNMYFLEEVITVRALRSAVAEEFRKISTNDLKVIDMLMFKANAELTSVLGQHFQRHHMITKYVSKHYDQGHINTTPASQSEFLTAFYKGGI